MKNKPLITDHDALPTNWYRLSEQETLERLSILPAEGLSSAEAEIRRQRYGLNMLPERPRKPAYLRFLAHFKDVLIYVLLVAAVLTGVMGHWVDTLVILAVAVINASIGFIQEYSAEKSLKSIQNILSARAQVIRDAEHRALDARQLVPGDIVNLRAGDRVPADLRLIEAHNLQVEEAILTGESSVIVKQTQAIAQEVMIGDRVNLAYSGTTVSAGSGCGVVIATGERTELGHINQMMAEVKQHRTPLLVQMDKLGKTIFIVILAMMMALFIFSLLLRDLPLDELLLSLISLAVASVPEGLPAIISIILSLGVRTMARQRAIIRKLPTVETLGAMTVICSDKTGTLTMNEMAVKAIILAEGRYRVDGGSYEPVGKIHAEGADTPVDINAVPALRRFLRTVDLCNDSQLRRNEQQRWTIIGGPTEGALKVAAAKAALPPADIRQLAKIPFDSHYKYMATCHHIDDSREILVTGAPDVLFGMCGRQLTQLGDAPFDLVYWENEMARYAREGLRMVASAYRDAPDFAGELHHEDLRQGMIFIGIAGMMDPPRPEAIDAIALCRQAGIRVKMITGDHQETAMAIGKMLGIGNSFAAVTGYQLEHMDDDQLADAASNFDIFARTSPEHKLRLVKALQEKGGIIGMTGDGVNDAPALKQAEVGIAMGIKGTEVTKEAADMVLTDDNFATIANAVKEGRRVYDNLQKTIMFIMPTNLAQGLLIIIALVAGSVMPLTPVQILWLNMATSATLSFGLVYEEGAVNLMGRPPRDPNKPVMGLFALWRVVFVGTLIAASAFMLEAWLIPRDYSQPFIRTVLLQTLVTSQWAYMLNCRVNDRFSLNKGLLLNKGIWVVTGALILLQLAIIYLPLMNILFDTAPLPFIFWLLPLAVGIVVFAVVEAEKQLFAFFRH